MKFSLKSIQNQNLFKENPKNSMEKNAITQFENAKTQFENAKTQFSGYPLVWTGLDRRPQKNPAFANF